MDDQGIPAMLQRHWFHLDDQEVLDELYHEDVVVEFPQSGEQIVGRAKLRAMREAYGATITFAIHRVHGSGDVWVTEGVLTYEAVPLRTVTIMDFQDGKVVRETIYVGQPLDQVAEQVGGARARRERSGGGWLL